MRLAFTSSHTLSAGYRYVSARLCCCSEGVPLLAAVLSQTRHHSSVSQHRPPISVVVRPQLQLVHLRIALLARLMAVEHDTFEVSLHYDKHIQFAADSQACMLLHAAHGLTMGPFHLPLQEE
jgi:hypothetical protein